MKLEYFDLLSPRPIVLPGAGGILSPFLKDIPGIHSYRSMLNILLMEPEDYFRLIHLEKAWEKLSPRERQSFHIFDLVTRRENDVEKSVLRLTEQALDFFFAQKVAFDEEAGVFYTYDDPQRKEPWGEISRDNYMEVCDIIARRNYIKRGESLDLSKAKSPKARAILTKLQKGRENIPREASANENYDLGNILSKVASRHPCLNPANICELTVFQLYDQFYNLIHTSVCDIQSMAYAFGGKSAVPDFDYTDWFHNNNNIS